MAQIQRKYDWIESCIDLLMFEQICFQYKFVSHCKKIIISYIVDTTYAWVLNVFAHKAWDEITYPFWNFNSSTIEVWE